MRNHAVSVLYTNLIQCFHLVNFVPDTATANQWLWCKLWLKSQILS